MKCDVVERTTNWRFVAYGVGLVGWLFIGGATGISFGAEPRDLAAQSAIFEKTIRPLVRDYCVTCHSTEKQEGKLDLERFSSLEQVRKQLKVWQHVHEQLAIGEMPPKEKPQPTEKEVAAVVGDIEKQLTGTEAKLANENFVAKAAPVAVQREREKLAAKQAKPSLRQDSTALLKQIVEGFSLASWLGTEQAKLQLTREPRPLPVPGEGVFEGVIDYWDIDEVRCYDPSYDRYSALPEGQFDGVISTDVLEHCIEDDIPWIVEEMFSYATRFVYAAIACYPAMAMLPTGENAHTTVRPPEWWDAIFAAANARHPSVIRQISIEVHDEGHRE